MNYLNLGCGSRFHPKWTNVDFISTGEGVIAHNLRQGLPFTDNSFDAVYHSHLLEHLPKSEAEPFLRECYRVLRPQGVIRVVVPNLEEIARLYLTALDQLKQESSTWADHYQWILLEMYDQVVRSHPGGEMATYLAQTHISNEKFVIERLGWEAENLIKALRQQKEQPLPPPQPLSEREQILKQLLGDEDYKALEIGRFRLGGEVHQWMYDQYSLTKLLQSAGFEKARVYQADESAIPDFAIFGLDVESDGRVRKPDSLFVEAVKPVVSEVASENSGERVTKAIAQPLSLQELPQFTQLQQSVQQLQEHLQQTQRDLQRAQQELEQSQSIISAMESSKFWKLRSLWMHLKQSIGLTSKN